MNNKVWLICKKCYTAYSITENDNTTNCKYCNAQKALYSVLWSIYREQNQDKELPLTPDEGIIYDSAGYIL
jgi:DNA-directed RNA polymerase subunit RPC12/RpoP